MKSAKEIRDEVRAIRERARGFSGYWVGEAAAATYALEWAIDKRNAPPSQDIGAPGGEHEKIAASLLKLAQTSPPPAKPAAPPKTPSGPRRVRSPKKR